MIKNNIKVVAFIFTLQYIEVNVFTAHTGSVNVFGLGTALQLSVVSSHLERPNICLLGITAFHRIWGKKLE